MTSVGTVLSSPIPAYQNVPIQVQFYIPNLFFISSISLGITTTVTTTVDHNYVIGQEVRLIIPPSFGSRQLNGQTGYVISIPSATQVQLSINSQNCDAFVLATSKTQSAQILAIGDINSGALNQLPRSETTFIPGSFLDISPL